MPKYIKITRNDVSGNYTIEFKDLKGIMEAEFDGIEDIDPGVSVTATVIEMSQEKYDALPEFTGW